MNIPRWTLAAGTAFVALLGTAVAAAAQGVTTGAVSGSVTGEHGEPLAGATIQLSNKATGIILNTVSRTNGRYVIPGLEVGRDYSISARRIGYEAVSRDSVVVTLGQTTNIDFVLSARATVLSGVSVTATAETQDVIMSPSHQGAVTQITDSALRRLPTLNRTFTDFVVLTPQVSATGPGLSGGGTNNRYNNIQIDGSIETDIFGLGSTGQPGGQANGKSIGLEAVREYQVLLAPYDVRQGNFAGLLVNAVTKSGTNDWHGTAFGVTRNQGLARSQPYITKYDQTQYGFSFGGPIVANKAFFFINPEWQTRTTPASGPYVGQTGVSLTAGDVTQVQQALSTYGIQAGNATLVNNENPLANLFARVDVALPWNTRLIVHHNYGSADQDIFSRSTSAFQLSDNGYKFKSKKNGTVAQFRTRFANGGFNELFLDNTSIRDRRAPNSRSPQVQVTVGSYNVVAGAERFSQGNELDQDIQEITDNYSYIFGNHRFTVGTQNQFIKFRNLFTQSSYGVWNFDNLDSLNKGVPNQYIIGVPLSGDGAVRFKAAQYAAYLQDEWAANSKLNLTLGLRLDDPVFRDKPPFNQEVATDYKRNTSDVPSGNIEWSPRFGFNYDITGKQTDQLRGGIGMFSGRPAYVWLSNAFQNSGSVGVAVLTCARAISPKFNSAAVTTPPQTCTNGLNAKAGGEIDLLDPNLKLPQNLRATLGYDRRLSENFIGTIEGMYTRGVNGLFYKNIALAGDTATSIGPCGGAAAVCIDKFGRYIYGNATSSGSGTAVVKPGPRTQIFDVTNQSKDHAYQLTGQIQRRYANNFEASLAYTYSRAWDAQSFTSSTAFSQYRFGRAWAGDQRDQTATRSIFEQPHKITAYATYTLPTHTDLSLTYIGASGTPYDYVVNGDPNGDNITLNDPIYVPKDVRNPAEIQWTTFTSGGRTVTVAEQQDAFEKFINSTPCLRDQRGQLLKRNSCDNPWTNTLNVGLRHNVKTMRGQFVTLEVQVYNFLNLLNSDWGVQPSAGFGSQSLLTMRSKTPTSQTLMQGAVPVYTFDPSYQKFLSNNIFSNYQIQLQARYSF
ncbi:MAG TPA: carboxypeptidase regulatory-like domain-containing protein [Gemmatimonadaceae bacterium]|jgi:carboxypeptidase family protein|nr:carboxypeptidase regulatory-like domain-containing protein [Gemmatimonadaceae bacterium]